MGTCGTNQQLFTYTLQFITIYEMVWLSLLVMQSLRSDGMCHGNTGIVHCTQTISKLSGRVHLITRLQLSRRTTPVIRRNQLKGLWIVQIMALCSRECRSSISP